jgi:hypothetical protein
METKNLSQPIQTTEIENSEFLKSLAGACSDFGMDRDETADWMTRAIDLGLD